MQAALLQEDPKEKDSSQKGGGSRKEQGEGKPRSSTAQPAAAGELSGEVWSRQHQSVRSRKPGVRHTEGLGMMAAEDLRDGAGGGEAQVGWIWEVSYLAERRGSKEEPMRGTGKGK